MAPSYEICAEESLVLSAEKYADAPYSRFRCGRDAWVARVLSADLFHNRNSSGLIRTILQNIQLQVSVGG